jgi:hypothetical protein
MWGRIFGLAAEFLSKIWPETFKKSWQHCEPVSTQNFLPQFQQFYHGDEFSLESVNDLPNYTHKSKFVLHNVLSFCHAFKI